ncbi:tRNA pseudouridine(38-40) synthase TruA [Candidatus Desantisbacteria bacterium]|nr:tRNA pseudouridine(38-40) synthase TruA [Candidatus Desantisbacteria bacterium]
MKRNIKLCLQYDGTNYYGWQKQSNRVTVAGVLEQAIQKATGEEVRIFAASRIDAGAHAYGQVVNFQTDVTWDTSVFPKAINHNLPGDIVVYDACQMPVDFHARFSASFRRYRYLILNSRFSSPFYRNYACFFSHKLDIDRMVEGAAFLVGKHDFASFCTESKNIENTVRRVSLLSIEKKKSLFGESSNSDRNNFISIDIIADAFLYGMIRSIVGILIDVGRGRKCIQMDVVLGNVSANLNRSMELIGQIAADKPDIICLPELFTTGYCLHEAKRLAEQVPGETTRMLSQKSREMGCFLIGGSIIEQEGDNLYNTSVVFNRSGEVAAKYRKMHLFAPFEEDLYLVPGDKTVVIDIEICKIGVIICYDLRFPELFKELSNAGAKIVFVVAEFPNPKLSDWKTLLMDMAKDNNIHVVGVNRIGSDEKSSARGATSARDAISFFGHTLISSPSGEIKGEMGGYEGVIVVDVLV